MVDPGLGFVALVLTLTTFLLVSRSWRKASRNLPRFIGDREDVGALLKTAALDGRGPWEVFDRLAKTYGPAYTFLLGGRPTMVISSSKLATELLEKKGEVFSSRPRMIMAHEIFSGGLRGLSSPYGDYWRKWRKIQRIGMSGRASLAYRDHQTLESTILLCDLLRKPGQYQEDIQRFAASVVLSISYGRRATTLKDELVMQNIRNIAAFQRIVASTGKFIVDKYPSLLWLPRPLQWFRHAADAKHASETRYYLDLLSRVRNRMKTGNYKECMASRGFDLLAGEERRKLDEKELAYGVVAPFGAGVDTTSGSIEYAILAALLHPSATRKAQAELDAHVGRQRFPLFSDEPNLPYVHAWILELTRWRPVLPLAVPHAVTRDEVWDNAVIPKDTTVYGNLETMMKDPVIFPSPLEFRPERFIDSRSETNQLRDFDLPFGFGRRQCPGMHVALQSMFIVISRLLWAFDIVQVGTTLPDPDAYVNHGLVRTPATFDFELRPRHAEVTNILRKEVEEALERLKEWEWD